MSGDRHKRKLEAALAHTKHIHLQTMVAARRKVTYVPCLILLLSVVIPVCEGRFCKSNQTSLQQVLRYIGTNIDVFQTLSHNDPSESTLSVCLKDCLDADCAGAVFCNGKCYLIEQNVLHEILAEAEKLLDLVATKKEFLGKGSDVPVNDLLSIKDAKYCVFYEHSPDTATVPEAPIIQSTTMESSTTTMTTPMPMFDLHYGQEEKLNHGILRWNNWNAGTTLQMAIPQDTEGTINFSPVGHGNGELSISITKNKEQTVAGSGSITVGTSSKTVIRLRKPSLEHSEIGIQVRFNGSLKGTLDKNYDGEYTITVSTTKVIDFYWNGQEECAREFFELQKAGLEGQRLFITAYVIAENACSRGTSAAWSVSLYHVNSFETVPWVKVHFALDKYYMAMQEPGDRLPKTLTEGAGTYEINKGNEVAVKFAIDNDYSVTGWINDKLITTVHLQSELNYLYITEGVMTTALHYE